MKRKFLAIFCLIMILLYSNSCCRNNKRVFSPYCDLQDSLEYFISNAPNFPENTASFVCAIFHAYSFEETEDTIVVLMKGNGPFTPVNGQKVIGATYFDKSICEVVFDGFEHLPDIVNEGILTLKQDDYRQYGYDKMMFNNSKYIEWMNTSGIRNQKETLTRTYRLNRPNIIERIQ